MKKNSFFYKKTLMIGSIAISVLILLASFPSIYASNIITSSNKIKEIGDNFVYNSNDINSVSPLGWSPGQFVTIFFLTLNLYIDYLKNNSWFPGLTFIIAYLFIVLCFLSLIEFP